LFEGLIEPDYDVIRNFDSLLTIKSYLDS